MSIEFVFRLIGMAVLAIIGVYTGIEFGQFNEGPDAFQEALSQPNGIVFVTGPTGSGKTTTLYSALNYIDKPDVNIMTIEDPVEYQVPSITQTQVDNRAGRSFSSILRSALRQDPDIILVGEIRDEETARIAAEAALTGHLVLSTLHTNSALQAVTRLIDMGVDAYIVAPAIVGVMAQRLVRKICEYCIEPYQPDEDTLSKYFYWHNDMPELPVLQAKVANTAQERVIPDVWAFMNLSD